MGVSLLSRKLDDVPTQPELLQYEKRFVELHETARRGRPSPSLFPAIRGASEFASARHVSKQSR